MPNWKKVITSGSDAAVKTLLISDTADGDALIGNNNILHEGITANANNLTVGTAAEATNATNATNVTTAADTGNAEHFVTFTDSAAATQQLKTDAGAKYNPSTNTMTIGRVAGTDIDAGSVTVSDSFDLRAGNGGIGTSGGLTAVGITNSSTYTGGARIILSGGAGSYIEATGYLSSSVSVNAPTGSFEVLTGDTSQATSLEVDGPVTASAFVGERIFIGGASANISTTTQNAYFYGGSNGLSSNTWNVQVTDPTAIPPQYVNNLHMIPCGVTNITVRSHNRIGLNSQPSIWIYTGSFGNDTNSNITMGFATSQSLHSPADNTSNSGTHRYVINITGSKAFELTGDNDVIAVMMKNEGTAGAWRFNYRIDGITTE